MKTLLVKSYGKINIALNVLDKRKDGYHELDMVMVPIDIHDSLLISEAPNRATHSITMDNYVIQDNKKNIVATVIEEIEKIKPIDKKFRVIIHKVLPVQAGFGGGSADAAGALIGFNQMLNLNLTQEEMMNIALTAGSDVPFFVLNKPARCRGRGEILTPINIRNDYFVVVVKPKNGCSTREIYKLCDELTIKTCNIEKVIEALETGNDDLLAENMCNSLQEAATSMVPEIQTILDIMKNNGFKLSMMTGSGSGVFALTTNKKEAKALYKKLDKLNYNVELTKVLK